VITVWGGCLTIGGNQLLGSSSISGSQHNLAFNPDTRRGVLPPDLSLASPEGVAEKNATGRGRSPSFLALTAREGTR